MFPHKFVTVAFLSFCFTSIGQEKKIEKAPFLIYAPKAPGDFTELQRLTHNSEYLEYIVELNATSVVSNQHFIDTKKLDMEAIHRALVDARNNRPNRILKQKVHFSLNYYNQEFVSDDVRSLLRKSMIGLGVDVGFENCSCISFVTRDTSAWKKRIAFHKAYQTVGPEQEKEPGIGNKHVTAFTVLTEYSKQLHDGSDCVVKFNEPFGEEWDGTLNAEQIQAVEKAVRLADVKTKQYITFWIVSRYASNKAQQNFSDNTVPSLLKKLGFASSAIITSH
ncbi:MAG: hypothetical protein R3B84_13665 [Zavarzinella sp.]